MLKKLKSLLGILLFLSICLNWALVMRYDILDKLQYRLGRFLESPPKALSEPVDVNSFRSNPPTVHYLTSNAIRQVAKSFEKENKDIPNKLIMPPGVYNFQGGQLCIKKRGTI